MTTVTTRYSIGDVVYLRRLTVLRLPSESADAALRRLERRPDFATRLVSTDEVQSLLREASRMAAEARRKGTTL
jgi:hypothetical protein